MAISLARPDGADWREQRDGVRLDLTVAPDSPVLQAFYAVYDQAFVLAREKEDIAGFQACMALNHGPAYEALATRYGPFREATATAYAGGELIGGANWIAFAPAGQGLITANLNYIFLTSAARGKGLFRQLYGAVRQAMAAHFVAAAPLSGPLIFIEQNDPFQMSAEDYAADTAFTGLDQFDRIGIWARLGARIIDFPYIQPALSPGQDPDSSLSYAVLGAETGVLSKAVLRAHLERFFTISVFKGRDALADGVARAQLEALAGAGDLNLYNAGPLAARLSATGPKTGLFPTLGAALKAEAAR